MPKLRFYTINENGQCLATDNIGRSEAWIKAGWATIDTELSICFNYTDNKIMWVIS